MSARAAARQHSTPPQPAQIRPLLRSPRCTRVQNRAAAFRRTRCSRYSQTSLHTQAWHVAGGTSSHGAASRPSAAAAGSTAALTSSSDDEGQQPQQRHRQRLTAGGVVLEHERPVLAPPRALPPPPAAEGLPHVLLYSFRICLTERWALPRLAAVFGLLAISRIAGGRLSRPCGRNKGSLPPLHV